LGWRQRGFRSLLRRIVSLCNCFVMFDRSVDVPRDADTNFILLIVVFNSSLAESKKDALLRGLLVPGFDKQSCASRYESVYYRKNMMRVPSPYLIKRLREHEALQRRCGPGTEPYARATERLRSENQVLDSYDGCSYLVLISYRGLGNRILPTNSAFLYALLTRRVLLVDPS
jgi:xyloglucan fucosyltransferase